LQVLYSIDQLPFNQATVATIGTFDGVHQGHREVIRQLKEEGKQFGLQTLLITFDPHPRIILKKDADELRLLSNPQEKIDILKELSIDFLLILPFTYEFSQTTARDFIQNYLIDKLHVQRMVIGYDHHFGRMDGGFTEVGQLLLSMGVAVTRIAEKDVAQLTVSSTKIRSAIENGDLEMANKLLGYPYRICGTVIHGQEVGRTLGYPTANILLHFAMKLLPKNGVYVVAVNHNQLIYRGIMNIGTRPTFGLTEKSIEVHLFNFDQDLYGEYLQLQVLHRVRDEKAFLDTHELKLQIQKDAEYAQGYFEATD